MNKLSIEFVKWLKPLYVFVVFSPRLKSGVNEIE